MTANATAEADNALSAAGTEALQNLVTKLVNDAITTGSETQDVTKGKGVADYRAQQVDSDVDTPEFIRRLSLQGATTAQAVNSENLTGINYMNRRMFEQAAGALDKMNHVWSEHANLLSKNSIVQQNRGADQQMDMLEQFHMIDKLFGFEEGTVQQAVAAAVANALTAKATT